MLRILKYSAILLLISLLHLYLYTSETIKSFDYKYNDNLNQLLQTKSSADNNVVVVDIDEESLHDFGQWPWPRIITAKLINDIDAMHPTTIAINILFPEKDRTSPVSIQNFYHNFFNLDIGITHLPETLQDNDKLLSDSIKKSQSILSIYFSSEDIEPHCQDLNYTKHQFNNIETTLNAKSIVCNEQQIQQNISNFGFINAQIDNDGLFRRMPLFMNYNNHLVPSFALATLLNIDHNIQNQEKKNTFSILGHTIRMNEDGYVLLNFNNPLPKIIPATKILKGEISSKELQGKIILIGSSAIGINHTYLLPNHDKLSNTLLHATLIENILNNMLYIQPNYYKKINIFISLFLSLLVLIFLAKRRYVSIVILFIITMMLSTLWLLILYKNNIYISIGYLWTPFLSFFFIVMLFFMFLTAKERKKSYEEILESHTATIDIIALISTMHDKETGRHIQRTKHYIKLMAEHLYKKNIYPNIITPKYINRIYRAAPLHDIGKMGIADKVLKKNGALTQEEFEIMKTHPTLAKNMLQDAMKHYNKNDFLNMAYNIAYYHHERWDGTGYPTGLKGNQIPLEAQLMTLADVYDALVSKRRYKKSFSFEEAETIILEGRGTAYNPKLIDAFIEIKDSFKEIAYRWQEQ